jgi:hypothetical protein
VLFYYPYKREPVQPCQVPRYIAHQVEYTLHTAPSDIEYLKRAVVVLEYSETQMELWRSFNVTNVFLVRVVIVTAARTAALQRHGIRCFADSIRCATTRRSSTVLATPWRWPLLPPSPNAAAIATMCTSRAQ